MKKIFQLLILSLMPLTVSGQLVPLTNQYILNRLSINPSYAGSRGALDVAAFYRRQWVGIDGAPQTISLIVDAPILSSKLGLGLIIVNDKVGVTKQNHIMTAYAYKISLGNGLLSMGLGAGVLTTNTAWSDLVVLDPGDEYYLIDSKVFVVPDFSFGMYYNYSNYFIGFSIPRLMGYKFDFNRNRYAIHIEPKSYSYMLLTGYMLNIAPKTKFLPSVLVSYSPNDKLFYDINAHFSLINKLWLGVSYRSTQSVVGLLQFEVNNQFKIAYSYDYNFGQMAHYNSGSHEVMLRYEFSYKVDAINPLIF
jgi:type IX secretion system PorP/SprF family membrane protein